EQGVIHTLLDKFGFILCADRNLELFFHYSELRDGHSDELNIGDEVEFRVGAAESHGKPPRAVNGVLRLAPEEPQKEDLEILFTPADYNPNSGSGGSSNRLGKGDVVEFTLVTERRTGKKYARNIQLIQSERERLRKVVSVRGDFGFLRSANRVEEVYFHVSNILEGETMLEEGTEVEFYVVNEGSQSSGSDNRLLPEGTVKFEHVLAEGVAGVVLDCPIEQRVDPFGTGGGRSEKKSGKAAIVGTIRLQEPITDEHNGEEVTEYQQRALKWHLSDQTARQTTSQPLNSPFASAEGVIRSIRDNYGFIHCAERNVDAYFAMYEVFPNELH
ncbi:hypothetical protein THAPSDRAFT_263580, partial [Thalassiosira pseudonana CCMP1335]